MPESSNPNWRGGRFVASNGYVMVLAHGHPRAHIIDDSYDWPLPNVHLGVTIESAAHIDRADILQDTPAAVRWISAEPLLGPLVERCATCAAGTVQIGAEAFMDCPDCRGTGWSGLDLTGIDTIVIGGESGPHARPMELRWLTDLVDAADAAGCAVYVKQDSGRAGQQGRIPDELWRRKELP